MSDRYRALRDGTGYSKGAIYESRRYKYGREQYICATSGYEHPIFYKEQLEDSPNFDLIEELWSPEVGEEFTTIYRHNDESLETTKATRASTDDSDFYNKQIDESYFIFRTEYEANVAIGEALQLIKKRSKESRRLGK